MSEERLDRIERILEETIEESRQWRRDQKRWMELLSQAVVDLTKLRTLEYEGPVEPVPSRTGD